MACLQADEPVHRAKIISISGQSQQTPEYQVAGPRDKPNNPRDWVEIEAVIEVQTTDPSGYIPTLEARWFAVVHDKFSKKPVRLLGSTTFKYINTADKKIFLSAYIEPDTLSRLTGKTKGGENDIEGYALTLSGPGLATEGKFGAGLAKATAEEDEKWWITWKHESLEDHIVPKSRTPFAPLWTDRYPTEKETGR